MGDAYAATPQAIPAGPQYVAMGHIHAPQKVPGAPVPAEYAGSLAGARLRRGRRAEARRDRRRRAGPARGRRDGRAAERPPAGARDRHVGRDRRPAGRARGRVPRPHREDDRHGHDAGGTRAADVPLPGEGPRVPAGSGERERVGEGRPLVAGAVRRVLPAGAPRRGAARRAARALPRRARGGGPMRPLELTVEGLPLLPAQDDVRLAGATPRRHRRSDRLGEVVDPRRDLVRAVRQDARTWSATRSR